MQVLCKWTSPFLGGRALPTQSPCQVRNPVKSSLVKLDKKKAVMTGPLLPRHIF